MDMQQKYPHTLQRLIAHLRKLPSVGTRTAERFAFDLLKWNNPALSELAQLLIQLPSKIIHCTTCGCLTEEGTCPFCASSRDSASLCVLGSPRDVYAIEETRSFKGLYHIVEHLISPLDGRLASTLRVDRIIDRIQTHRTKEVILAFDSTLEGDATALFLKQQLTPLSISITRLAFGLPIGSNLEYIDTSTLARALSGRQIL